MTDKEKYKALCEIEESIPLFSQAWWLDSVCGDDYWDVCLVEKGDEIIASMPYLIKSRYGLKISTQPQLTQNLGPWIRKSNAQYIKHLSNEKKILDALFSQLPKFAHFNQNWHYKYVNWLPLYWLGYSQTTKYTYVIDNLLSKSNILRDFQSSYRNKIKNSSKILYIKSGLDDDLFFEINKKTFERQNIKIPYTFDFYSNHSKAIRDNESGEIFYACDEHGNIHSALYLTWDSMSSYVHMVGEDPKYRSSGAGVLLIFHVIEYTKNKLKLNRFDFEGSMIESIEKVRRGCSGIQTPYFSISKTNSKILKIRNVLKEII